MIIDYKKKIIRIKIVYYGCAMSGKTTSLKEVFHYFNKEDTLTSIETTTGRTLFFDFGTLKIKGGEWDVSISLFSATGQDFYASTRPATLSSADGIIFVIDSQKKYLDYNINSWNELNYYFAENLEKIPLIICLNKRDLPEVINADEIEETFHLRKFQKVELLKTIATEGKGTLLAFKRVIGLIFPTISIK